jgi:thiol-disulfide isomerase/thioredoxin
MKTPNTTYLLIVVAAIALLFLVGMSGTTKEGFASAGDAGANTLTLYYADWCPHCKTVKPAFESWMSKQTMVTAKMYEADKDSAAVQAAGVKGFPTFQLTKEDGSVVETSARDPAGWEAFLKENM